MNDHELLREYVGSRSQAAFTQLVERHVNLVYSAARRRLRDPHLAEDVAQQVFTLLAQKAGGLGTDTILPAWLYRAACHVASVTLRNEGRRQRREQAATELMDASDDQTWREIEPALDEAMSTLNPAEHDAVVLRFFERLSLREVGVAQGITDDAAQKRVTRAMEKLRAYFQRWGQAATVAGLSAAILSGAVQPAPSALAALIVAGTSTAIAGVGAAATLIKPLLLMKTKLIFSLAAVAAIAVPVTLQQRAIRQLREQNLALRDATARAGAPPTDSATTPMKADPNEQERLRAEHLELMRLRAEVARLRETVAQAAAAPRQKSNVARVAGSDQEVSSEQAKAEADAKVVSQLTANVLKQLGLAVRIYATDHGEQYPTNFEALREIIPGDLPGGLGFDKFEFVTHATPMDGRRPELLLLRERAPRQMPNGTWAKAYALADGSVVEKTSDDGNFSGFENQHTIQQAASQ